MYRLTTLLTAILLLSAAVAAQKTIRRVDFRNFTFEPYCTGETPDKITVKNGEFSEEKHEDGYVDRFYFKIFAIEYGDLNGDRMEEAVLLSVCNTGGTGNFTEGFIFGMNGDKPRLLARIPGGDRAYGGLRSAKVEKGLLVVESNDVGEMGGACCPEFVVTSRFKLFGDEIKPVGIPDRREIFPIERLTFTKGTSGTTFKTTLSADEGRRFVVGARAGQVLTVSIDTDQAGLRLLEDASVTFGINNFLARLPKTGDYTIEIQNNSGAELPVLINVKIQ